MCPEIILTGYNYIDTSASNVAAKLNTKLSDSISAGLLLGDLLFNGVS
jgi:hypothetical protein